MEESRQFNPHKDSKVARNHEYEHRHFLNILFTLPSAQLEKSTTEEKSQLAEEKSTCNLIRRQDAIDLLKKWSDGYSYIEVETNSAIKTFEALPSAQPKMIRGHWRVTPMACYGGGTITEYECSECEEHQITISNFCPNCGARMENK